MHALDVMDDSDWHPAMSVVGDVNGKRLEVAIHNLGHEHEDVVVSEPHHVGKVAVQLSVGLPGNPDN